MAAAVVHLPVAPAALPGSATAQAAEEYVYSHPVHVALQIPQGPAQQAAAGLGLTLLCLKWGELDSQTAGAGFMLGWPVLVFLASRGCCNLHLLMLVQ